MHAGTSFVTYLVFSGNFPNSYPLSQHIIEKINLHLCPRPPGWITIPLMPWARSKGLVFPTKIGTENKTECLRWKFISGYAEGYSTTRWHTNVIWAPNFEDLEIEYWNSYFYSHKNWHRPRQFSNIGRDCTQFRILSKFEMHCVHEKERSKLM